MKIKQRAVRGFLGDVRSARATGFKCDLSLLQSATSSGCRLHVLQRFVFGDTRKLLSAMFVYIL